MKLYLTIIVDCILLHTVLGFLLDNSSRDQYRCPHNVRHGSRLFAYGQYCIQFVIGDPTYWSDARSYCHSRGGTLVSIPDARTQAFLMKALSWLQYDPGSKGFWIGLNDRDDEKHYKWDNGHGLHGYSYWGKDGASNLFSFAQDCVVLQVKDHGHWWDEPCGLWPYQYNFICQYDMLPTTTTKTTVPSTVKTTTKPTTTTTTLETTTKKPTTPVPTSTFKTTTEILTTTTTVACQDIDCQKSCPGGYSGVSVGHDGCVTCRCT